jgi:hypothetical protein
MTPNAQAFKTANAASPVVFGCAQGGYPNTISAFYRLKSGQTFNLTAEECRQVGRVRWHQTRDNAR